MEFDYIKHEGDVTVYWPTLPIALNGFPIGHALVDSGADITIFPMEVNKILDVELDTDKAIEIGSAGGGKFTAIPSKTKISYTIEKNGYRTISWNGTAYFAPRQPTILLGQYQCLDKLEITLDGINRKIKVKN